MSRPRQPTENDVKVGYFPVTLPLFQEMCRLKLSTSAQTVLLYIIRHTVGWQQEGHRQRFTRFKVQDFIQGRPTPSGDDRFDAGTPLTHPATVMAALEECGVKGFIFELDDNNKEGYRSYGLQWKYFADYEKVSEAEAKIPPTPKYRYKPGKNKGQFEVKPDEEQTPHYYGVPGGRKKGK